MIRVAFKFFMVPIPTVFLFAETGKIFRTHIPWDAGKAGYVIILYQL